MNKNIQTVLSAAVLAAVTAGTVYLDTKPTPVQTVELTVITSDKYSVPDGDTSFKSYMDYRAITNIRSDQFKLQQECVTDSHGLRRYGEDYVIAVGSYYSKNIGDRLTITLDNGDSFTAVVGDFKANKHTDSTNRYYAMSGGKKNVIEFIVDTDELDSKARRMGDISYIDGFSGNITDISRTVKS